MSNPDKLAKYLYDFKFEDDNIHLDFDKMNKVVKDKYRKKEEELLSLFYDKEVDKQFQWMDEQEKERNNSLLFTEQDLRKAWSYDDKNKNNYTWKKFLESLKGLAL